MTPSKNMMMANQDLRCEECNMTFKKIDQLQKHKDKFCIGATIGDPNSLQPGTVAQIPRVQLSRASDGSRDSPGNNEFRDDYRAVPFSDTRRNQQLRIAEEHGRQVADVKNRQSDLEKQKDDIRRRLKELTSQDYGNSVALATSNLVKDLKDKEEQNQGEIQDLRSKMENMVVAKQSVVPWNPYVHPGKSQLYNEIATLQQSYLSNGGSDPAILAQIAEMLREADTMTGKPKKKKRGTKSKYGALADQLIAFEIENQRLQRELLMMQEKGMVKDKDNRGRDTEDRFERDMKRMQMEHMNKMQQLHQEMELTKHQMLLEKYRRDLMENIPQAPPPKEPEPPVQALPNRAYAGMDVPRLNVWQREHPGYSPHDDEPITSSNYDQTAGFTIFHDFVMGLERSVSAIRVSVSLYTERNEMGDPSGLPVTNCNPSPINHSENIAMVGLKQGVPKCAADAGLSLVVEMQMAEGPHSKLATTCWSKIDLFDDGGQLYAGRYRLPMRVTPVTPEMGSYDVTSLAQYGNVELFFRIVNARDVTTQSKANIDPTSAIKYEYPTQETAHLLKQAQQAEQDGEGLRLNLGSSPPPESERQRQTQREIDQLLTTARERGITDLTPGEDVDLGFQVIRVKDAEPGEAKVRLTAYYSSSGDVAQSETSPITCSTTAVRSSFKHQYHVFGHQEALFRRVALIAPVVLVARFYLRRSNTLIETSREDKNIDRNVISQPDARIDDEEALVAWGTLPLFAKRNLASNPLLAGVEGDLSLYQASVGKFSLQLYRTPVPDADRIPLDPHTLPKEWTRYGQATVRIKIFLNETNLESSDDSDMERPTGEQISPDHAWMAHQRVRPPVDPFTMDDAFDLYIDGCRFLPDSVTFTRVAGRILSRRYDMIGRDISALCKVDSSVYNPKFDYKQEYRDSNLVPTSTLLLKVYTIDRFTNQLTIVGYATLNIFVETGTEKQPITDEGGQLISLNEGAHQIRLYHYGPSGVDPLTESCMRDRSQRHIPCASILVRIMKAPIDPQARLLRQDKVPYKDWKKLGLLQARPRYDDGVYYSLKCKPTPGELRMFPSLVKRPPIKVSSQVEKMAGRKHLSDRRIEEYMKTECSKLMDVKPLEQNMTFIAKYSPQHGIKVSIDSAMNLPWSNFTHGQLCLNPPGAYYQGAPYAAYDKLVFTRQLDLSSSNKSPAWLDGLHQFANRSYHRYLTLIVHLQEIAVTTLKDSYKYGLLEQAWTPVQVFEDEYCKTDLYQLPLYEGAPTFDMLSELSRQSVEDWTNKMIVNGKLKLIEGASVFVRVADGRRDDELTPIGDTDRLELNTEYIPLSTYGKYKQELAGESLLQLVPIGKIPEQFVHTLAFKYRNLVYKLYEDDGIAS